MIGAKLAQQLARDGSLGAESIEHLLLVDIVEPEKRFSAEFEVETVVADLVRPGVAGQLVSERPETIFHLAAVVSGEAEEDFEKGYRVNMDGTRCLLDAIRGLDGDYRPRLVFASSIAVFGAPFPDVIGDDFRTVPLTSYGTQKAICELLLSDYTRRGFVDGVGVRLPTISVRPGRPNRAASGFFSSIIREPLNRRVAVLPVPDDVRHWHASPRAAVGFLLHAATIETSSLGNERCLTMPGVSVTVAGQIAALRSLAGAEAVRLIRREPDESVLAIVAGWPREFAASRATALGFRAEATFEEIIRVYVEDELGGAVPTVDP
jgi:nucleoside-diphosphate-sugar epimerase